MTEGLPRKRPAGGPKRQWRRPIPEDHINQYPPLISGAIAASAAVVFGYIFTLGFIMASWLFAAHGSESTLQVLRAAGIAWQVLHLVPFVIGTTTIGVLPWGFLVVPIFVLWKATQWSLKSSRPKTAIEFVRVALALSLSYSALAGLVSLISSTADLYTSSLSAVVHTLLVSLAVTMISIISFAPSRTILTDALPTLFVAGIRPAVIAFGMLFVAGSFLTSVSLIFNWDQIRAVTTLMAPGFIDGLFMTLLGIGYLPTASVWAMSYVMGPGIMLGGGGVVTPETANPGVLPAFPLLSILPSESAALAGLVLIFPILVGVAIHFLIPRERWSAQGDSLAVALSFVVRWREMVTLVSAIGLVSLFVWIAASASSGSLGVEYLRFVGPVPSQVAVSAIAICGTSALLMLLIPRVIMSIIHCRSHRDTVSK